MLVAVTVVVVIQHSILEIKNKASIAITDNGTPHLYEARGLELALLGLGGSG